MISAAGRPILSSPSSRSLWESSLRSRATVHSPVIDTLNPLRPSAASTASARSSTPPSDSSRSTIGINSAWRSADTRRGIGPLVIDHGARHVAGGPGGLGKAADLGPERGLVDREAGRPDHHHLARAPVGQALVDQVLGPDRVGVVDLPSVVRSPRPPAAPATPRTIATSQTATVRQGCAAQARASL